MARPAAPIVANSEEHKALLHLSGAGPHRRAVRLRAQVILLSIEGHTLDAIMERTGLGRTTVVKWRERFRMEGLDGLVDAVRTGRPLSLTNAQRIQLREEHKRPRSRGSSSVAAEDLAERFGVSPATVYRILANHKRVTGPGHWPVHSSDDAYPRSTAHVHALLGVHLDHDVRAFAIGQLILDPSMAIKTGCFRPERFAGVYGSFGGALAVALAADRHEPQDRNRAIDLLSFLNALERHFSGMRIFVHVHCDQQDLTARIAGRSSSKRKLAVYNTLRYDEWIAQLGSWLLLSPEHIPEAHPRRRWERYVADLLSRVKEHAKGRALRMTWLNDRS